MATATRETIGDIEAKRLPRFTLFFFRRPLLTLALWLAVLGFGIASYTTLMGRQGFPPVQAPISIVTGTYLVDNPSKVDADVGEPVSKIALNQTDVKTVTSTANANTFQILIQYKDGTEPQTANNKLKKEVESSGKLPANARAIFQTIDVAKFSPQGEGFDILIAVYQKNGDAKVGDLVGKAEEYVNAINNKNLGLVKETKVISPFSEGINPATGKKQQVQTGFDRYGERTDGRLVFHDDVAIGIKANQDVDTVKLYEQVKSALDSINQQQHFSNFNAAITASFAPTIQQEINELQKTLLEGLIAVLLVGTVLIALRASLLVIISMLTVIAAALGLLYLLGYTLNVIILFSIILGLALIVDDTIIMTEAIDVERRRQKNAADTVGAATNRVSLAMIAATSTAVLGFVPLLFITGILGGFIRPIPITIIASLTISLLVALTIIPFVARLLILRQDNIGSKAKVPYPVRLQESFAKKLTAPLRWAKHSSRRLWISGIAALILGTAFIFGGMYIFKYVTFNIFPSNKDSNQLQITMEFPAGTDINKAQATTSQADRIIESTLGANLDRLNYYSTASTNSAQVFIDLIPYTDRSITAPQLVNELKTSFKDFKQASVTISQQDVGGPPGSFNVLIQTSNREQALKLGADMASYLNGKTLKRADGSEARITRAIISAPDAYIREDNKQLVQVTASFDANDTSTLVTLAEDLTKKHYTNGELAKYNLSTKDIVYDFGFENENQKSFNSMLIAFPILLLVMYLVLALEFRSLLQPVLIFLAIPFSFFGVTGGLWLTDNPFSFFTLLGFFALVGLSIKNTILLTDYANQARRAGLGRVDAISLALEERFRPLLATSATAIFSLLPLALTSPFWESLAYTLIFGLLSSTTLVLLIFPYYYLGGEYLRLHISRGGFFKWLIINLVIIAGAVFIAGKFAILAFVILNVVWWLFRRTKSK